MRMIPCRLFRSLLAISYAGLCVALAGCDGPHSPASDAAKPVDTILDQVPAGFVSFYGGQVIVPRAADGDWQWHPMAIGNGGSNIGLHFDPRDPRVMYQTSDVAGVTKTLDGGKHWFAINTGLQGLANGSYGVGALAVDPANSGILYAAVGRTWEQPSGMVRSQNGGQSWEWLTGEIAASGEGPTAKKFGAHGILVDPSDSLRLYAVDSKHNEGAGGVWISGDAGKTWSVSGLDLARVSGLRFEPKKTQILWASAMNHPKALGGMYRSTDQGATWRRMGLEGKDVYNFQFDSGDYSVLYAVCGTEGVFKSTDAGLTWQAINSGLPLQANGAKAKFFPYLYRALDVDPFRPRHVIVTADVIRAYYESVDGGETWNLLPIHSQTAPTGWMLTGEHMGWHTNQIYFHPAKQGRLYACDFFGTWRSDDGGSNWVIHPYGAEQSCMVTVLPDVSVANRIYLGIWDHDVLIYQDHPTEPKTQRASGARQESNNTNHHASGIAQDRSNADTLLAVMNSAALIRSEDRGAHWSLITAGLPEKAFWRIGAPALADEVELYFLPVNGDAGNGGGVYVSQDRGATWSRAQNHGLPNIDVTGRWDPRQNVFDVDSDARVLALVSRGKFYISTDHAETWKLVKTPGLARCVAAASTRQGVELWVGGNGAVWKSADAGESWESVWSGVGQVELIAIEGKSLLRALIHTVQKGADGLGRIQYGLELTEDGGKSWTALCNQTLPVWRLRSISFDPFNRDRVLASTQWAGTWIAERPRGETVAAKLKTGGL